MAHLKSIKQKDKTYIFKAFGNEKSESPALVVFSRFPLPDEIFPLASQKNVLDSAFVKDFDNTPEAREKLVKGVFDSMIQNMTANRFDHTAFTRECVDHFESFIYEDKLVVTVDDFLSLPQEAVQKITRDIYLYSKIEDEFAMGE
jgi:hypothetical protein